MGDLIHLPVRAAEPPRPASEESAAFFFDVSSPLSYLTAEFVERTLGEIEWVAVDGSAVQARRGTQATLRARAETRARALRLPLVWPDAFPASAPCALRAAAYACETGAGPAFALAAMRLAFCGGFDLDEPETLVEAAAAAGVPLQGALDAARETWRDDELGQTAELLREHGVTEMPAITVAHRWFSGDTGLLSAASVGGASIARAAVNPESRRCGSPVAPVA